MSTPEQQISAAIKEAIAENDILLFMKGTPEAPRCGFSARTVAALESLGAPFAAVDILPDPRIRQELSAISNWPTIPQLFVRGELIGGCDIVTEMYESGELAEAIGVEQPAEAAEAAEPEARRSRSRTGSPRTPAAGRCARGAPSRSSRRCGCRRSRRSPRRRRTASSARPWRSPRARSAPLPCSSAALHVDVRRHPLLGALGPEQRVGERAARRVRHRLEHEERRHRDVVAVAALRHLDAADLLATRRACSRTCSSRRRRCACRAARR